MRLLSFLLMGFLLSSCLAACGWLHLARKAETIPPTAQQEQAIAGGAEKNEPVSPATPAIHSIAVFPFENLSGTRVDLKSMRASFIEALEAHGIPILDDKALEEFMVRNRVRYTAGINDQEAQALKKETGADGVLLTSLELFSEAAPPKVALNSRLVSAGDTPQIVWADGVGLAGDDHPGLLGLGEIDDSSRLLAKALQILSTSLEDQLSGAESARKEKVPGKFRPKIAFLSRDLIQRKRYTVAVAPFFNKSERKNAGDIVALQFVSGLHRVGELDVIEPGLVREALLKLRMIMDQGVSMSDANALFAVLNADLVLGGEVLDYQDYQGSYGFAKVQFAAQLIEKRSQKVVWSSESYNRGNDGVFFFDAGKVNTAHAMTKEMIRFIGNMLEAK